MRLQTIIIYLAVGSAPLTVASPTPIDALAARAALPAGTSSTILAVAATKRDDEANAASLDNIQNQAPAEETAAGTVKPADENIGTDKLKSATLGWGGCRRGLDVVDTTGLCCKRGLDLGGGGACCNGWILKRGYDGNENDGNDNDNNLLPDGRGNNGQCRRTLIGAGECCAGGL